MIFCPEFLLLSPSKSHSFCIPKTEGQSSQPTARIDTELNSFVFPLRHTTFQFWATSGLQVHDKNIVAVSVSPQTLGQNCIKKEHSMAASAKQKMVSLWSQFGSSAVSWFCWLHKRFQTVFERLSKVFRISWRDVLLTTHIAFHYILRSIIKCCMHSITVWEALLGAQCLLGNYCAGHTHCNPLFFWEATHCMFFKGKKKNFLHD